MRLIFEEIPREVEKNHLTIFTFSVSQPEQSKTKTRPEAEQDPSQDSGLGRHTQHRADQIRMRIQIPNP